jgi:hypothetical protein
MNNTEQVFKTIEEFDLRKKELLKVDLSKRLFNEMAETLSCNIVTLNDGRRTFHKGAEAFMEDVELSMFEYNVLYIEENVVKSELFKIDLMKKYPAYIIGYVRGNLGLDLNDDSMDDKILRMSPDQVFKRVVEWNGLLGGYDYTIKGWIKSVYGIEIGEEM